MKARMRATGCARPAKTVRTISISPGSRSSRTRHKRNGGNIGLDMEADDAIEAELAQDRAAGHQHFAGDLVSSCR